MSEVTAVDVKHLNELKVYRGDTLAGVLKRTDQGCELHFDQKFVANKKYEALTYCIPKQSEPLIHRGMNLPPFFAGLLPEGLRFKALAQQLKTSEDDLFSLLAASGERTVGDVYTLAEGLHRPELEIPEVGKIDFYQFFSSNIQSGLVAKSDESLAGVQEKISASMISFPVHTAKKNKSYILKLNPKDKPNLTQNEMQCLLLAKKCGLEANGAKLVYDKNKNPGILVERFDRVEVEGKLVMVHQEDACQFLNRYPADKYRLSFAEICEGIQGLATAPLIETLKVIQLYVFSYLIGNGDLHAKNISLQTAPQSGRVQLTPAYDLICTYLYKDHSMALKLDGRDKNFKRQYILDFGQRFGLQKKAIQQMLNKLLQKLQKNKKLLLEIPGLSNKEQSQLHAMLNTRISELSK